MSEDFIPLNQSTPVPNQEKWQNYYQGGNQACWGQNLNMRGSYRKNGNHSQNTSSFVNDSNNSYGKDTGIDAYLHPSMLQDPWAYLRRKHAEKQSN